jgi:hypothetical protein
MFIESPWIVARMNTLPIGTTGEPPTPAGSVGRVPTEYCRNVTAAALTVHPVSGIGTDTSMDVDETYVPVASSVIVVCATVSA